MTGAAYLRLLVLIGVAAVLWVGYEAGRRWWLTTPPPAAPLPPETAQAAEPPFTPPVLPPAPSQAFAGSRTCAECHNDVSEQFHAHPMGRSLARVTEASPLESYGDETHFTLPNTSASKLERSYYVDRDGDTVRHHEAAVSAGGRALYDLGVPVEYAVGSGQRGRSYLVNRDGLLYMSPLTWYSGAKRWDLSPGYQLNNLRFGRRIIDGCVNCHAGRVDAVAGSPNRYAANPFIEESISCERCHGPSQPHVDYWRRGDAAVGADPILKLGELTPTQQDHLCFQCHLIGEHRLTRYGRTDFDFRPGNHLGDVWTLFVKGSGAEGHRTQDAVSQVEQMLGSTCHQRSEGRLHCVSCHDPHTTPAEADRVEFYRTRCLNCHGPEQTQCTKPVAQRLEVTAVDSCIHCHMPAVLANDVPHTAQTDHTIYRDYTKLPPPPPPSLELHIFGEADGIIPESELDRARALAMVRLAESNNDTVMVVDAIPLLEQWLKVVPDDVDAIEALGVAFFLLQNYPLAASVWERGLDLFPDHEHLLRRLLLLSHQSEQHERGIEFGRRLTAVNPWDYEYFGRMAHMFGQLNRFDESIEAAEQALRINPAAAEIHRWLAEVHAIRGNPQRSAHHRSYYEALSK